MAKVEQLANESLSRLVEHVLSHRNGPITGLTYEELAMRIGKLNKQGTGVGILMGKVLGVMGHKLDSLQGDEWGDKPPCIQSLVVNKSGNNRGLPAEGISEFWPNYRQLSPSERAQKVQKEYEQIVNFGSRWNRVLSELGLAPVTVKSVRERLGTSGESNEHRAFKEYIRDHPLIVGASSAWQCDMEYVMPSLDAIDLLFRTKGQCIAVEVKSKLSDRLLSDYERGLYQAIKYQALLKAMAADGRYKIPQMIRTVLVLESRMPSEYTALAKKLNIEFIDGIMVKQFPKKQCRR